MGDRVSEYQGSRIAGIMSEGIVSFLAYLLIKIVCKTLSVKIFNREILTNCQKQGQPFTYAFWHGRQFLLLGWNPVKQVVVMTSLSRDGRFQDRVLKRLGLWTVPGSSSRGGVRGLVEMIRLMRISGRAGFAVDGPRGPLHTAKPGVVYFASRTNSVILPLAGRVCQTVRQ